jgi:hypothetical protein
VKYTLTTDKSPPESIEPVEGNPGLVWDWSLYDAWELMGTVKGEAYETVMGEMYANMATPRLNGHPMSAEDIARSGYYSKLKDEVA